MMANRYFFHSRGRSGGGGGGHLSSQIFCIVYAIRDQLKHSPPSKLFTKGCGLLRGRY